MKQEYCPMCGAALDDDEDDRYDADYPFDLEVLLDQTDPEPDDEDDDAAL